MSARRKLLDDGIVRYLCRPSQANTNVSPIPSSNCPAVTPLFLCIQHIRIKPVCANENSPGGHYGSNQCYRSASAGKGYTGCSLRSWKLHAGHRHPIQIQGRAVGDECSRREYFGRRSDGPVVSGSQPDEMAPGSYDMVFRDVRVASVPHGLPTFSGRISLAFQQLLQLAQPLPGLRSRKFLRSAHILTRRWTDFLRAGPMRKQRDA
jgi:hypothetical protein